MKFYRIYVELTNVCGLKCSFCPAKSLPSCKMDLGFFDEVISQCSKFTQEIACHLMGDPLTLSNLTSYLDIIHTHHLKSLITTSGYYLNRHSFQDIFHPSLKQLNISLNAYNKNDSTLSFEEYIEPVLKLCEYKLKHNYEVFVNLRLWNIDESMSDREYNDRVFEVLSKRFGVSLDSKEIYQNRPKSIRVAYKVLLHFDEYFVWPSLSNPVYGDGKCLGLKSHIGIMCDGSVVPCCLDDKGVINLGNLKEKSLSDILNDKRAVDIKRGFEQGKAVEELCQRCSYKDRFI